MVARKRPSCRQLLTLLGWKLMMYSRRFIPHRVAEQALRAASVTLWSNDVEIQVSGADLLDAGRQDGDDGGWRVSKNAAFGIVFQRRENGAALFHIKDGSQVGSLIQDLFRFDFDEPGRLLGGLILSDLYFVVQRERYDVWCTSFGERFAIYSTHWERSETHLLAPTAVWKEDLGKEGQTDQKDDHHEQGQYRFGLSSFDLGWVYKATELSHDDMGLMLRGYQRLLRRYPGDANELVLDLLRREDARRDSNAHRAPFGSRRTALAFDWTERDLALALLCLPVHLSTALAHRELREIGNHLAIRAHDADARKGLGGELGAKLTAVLLLLVVLVGVAMYAVFR